MVSILNPSWGSHAFFSRLTSRIARGGENRKILGVTGVMVQLLQIATDYSSLPDLRTLELHEIRFFYEPLIPNLIEYQIKAKE
jgi:hypothetical protein